MSDFFDFREFIINTLKKLKFILIVTLIFSLLLGVLKLFSGISELMRYNSANENTTTKSVLPYDYLSQNIINLQGSKISVDEFMAYGRDEDLVNQLNEKYFATFKDIYSDYQQRLVKYRYRTQEEFNKEINAKTFSDSFSLYKTSETVCTISVVTPDAEFSESILKDYSSMLIKLNSEKFGQFNYMEDKAETRYYLAGGTAGLIPVTVEPRLNNNNIRSIGSLVLQVVKAMIKGALVGIAVSILLIFFFYSISKYINSYKDLREWDLLYLGSMRMSSKPSKFDFINKFMSNLYQEDRHSEIIKNSITNKINAMEKSVKEIFLTGTVDKRYVTSVQEKVKNILGDHIIVESFPSVIDETVNEEKLKDVDNVILIEKIEVSTKLDIDLEMKVLKNAGKEILGCILIIE